MSKTKIIAMYLPQYHEIPENSKFWGEGFTDWVSVKKAEPLYKGHKQPKMPQNGKYYDLSKKENVAWQAKIAKKYGVDGFGIYHYWFSSKKQLLTKPAEIILENKDIDIPFFFAWDNISWKRTWSKLKGNDWSPIVDDKAQRKKDEPEILIEYVLGDKEEWKSHFDYLLPYFKDDRYIKKEGRPVFVVYHYDEKIILMGKYWNELAQKNGLSGVEIIYRYDPIKMIPSNQKTFTYEPPFSGWGTTVTRVISKIERVLGKNDLQIYEYDKVWKKIIENAKKSANSNVMSGAFVEYDDTPRRGKKGKVVTGATPQKFEKYMAELLRISSRQNKDFIFLTAWNEWGEGAYLEPDTENGYAYLEALKRAVESVDAENA